MKYIWTAFWAFLLIQMLTYVACSMIGAAFSFQTGSIIAVGVIILIWIVPAVFPNENTKITAE